MSSGYTSAFARTAPVAPAIAFPHGGSSSACIGTYRHYGSDGSVNLESAISNYLIAYPICESSYANWLTG